MHQNTPNYNSDTHFGQLSFLGGGLGAQSGFWAEQGGFSEARALVFFSIVFYRSTEKVLGGGNVRFRFHPFINTSYSKSTHCAHWPQDRWEFNIFLTILISAVNECNNIFLTFFSHLSLPLSKCNFPRLEHLHLPL